MNYRNGQGVLEAIYPDMGVAFPYLIREFAGVKKGEEVHTEGTSVDKFKEGTFKTLAGVRCRYSVPSSDNGTRGNAQETRFLVKYFWPTGGLLLPEGLMRRDGKPWEREYAQYEFLSGSAVVPEARLIGDIVKRQNGFSSPKEVGAFLRKLPFLTRAVILDYCGDSTLEQVLETVQGEDKSGSREELLKLTLESLTTLQRDATNNHMIGKSRKFPGLFDERDKLTQGVDYVRACLGYKTVEEMPEQLRERARRAYALVAKADAKGKQDSPWLRVCHGDLSPAQIIQDKYIDFKLMIGDGINDVACLVSSPGVNLTADQWNNLFMRFRTIEIDRMGVEGRGLWPVQAVPSRDLERTTLGNAYWKVVHNSSRCAAKAADIRNFAREFYDKVLVPQRPLIAGTCNEMRTNLTRALGEMDRKPERFGITTAEDRKDFDECTSLFDEISSIAERHERAHHNAAAQSG
jgi:hypothetical protein